MLSSSRGFLQPTPAAGDGLVAWVSTDTSLPRGRDETIDVFEIERPEYIPPHAPPRRGLASARVGRLAERVRTGRVELTC